MGWVFCALVALTIFFYVMADKIWQLSGMFLTLSAICGLLAAVVLLGYGDPAS